MSPKLSKLHQFYSLSDMLIILFFDNFCKLCTMWNIQLCELLSQSSMHSMRSRNILNFNRNLHAMYGWMLNMQFINSMQYMLYKLFTIFRFMLPLQFGMQPVCFLTQHLLELRGRILSCQLRRPMLTMPLSMPIVHITFNLQPVCTRFLLE